MEFEFEMKFKLRAASADPETLVERLGAAGRTDAVVGIGIPGRIALSFTRETCSANAPRHVARFPMSSLCQNLHSMRNPA
jgi:hypothetical protein